MSNILAKLFSKIVYDGIGKLAGAIISFVSKTYREYSRKKKSKKYEESGDEKDLLDLEDDLNS